MRIEHLILFREVCEMKSISKVAERNYMSRSSLSAIITAMEKELGFNLFKRSKKGVLLTDNGAVVYSDSESICTTYLEWLKISENDETIKGTVVIGVNSYYPRDIINDIIMECHINYPNITLLLSIIPPGRNDLLFKGIKDNSLSFIYTPISQEEREFHFPNEDYLIDVMCKSTTRIIMRKGHPLASREELVLDDLKELTYILASYDTGALTTRVLPYFKNSIRYVDTPGILSSIVNSDFVTVFAGFSLVNVNIEDYALIPCKEIEDELSFSLIRPQDKNMTLAEKKVMMLFEKSFTNYINSLPKEFVQKELLLD